MKLSQNTLRLTALVTSLLIPPLASSALAQSNNAQDLYQRGLAATCANCHGTDGKGVENGGMPMINTLSSEQMLTQLKAFKSGAREGTIMPQLAKGYSDDQLQTVANLLGKK
jgi:cytochrome c553